MICYTASLINQLFQQPYADDSVDKSGASGKRLNVKNYDDFKVMHFDSSDLESEPLSFRKTVILEDDIEQVEFTKQSENSQLASKILRKQAVTVKREREVFSNGVCQVIRDLLSKNNKMKDPSSTEKNRIQSLKERKLLKKKKKDRGKRRI